MDAAYDFTYRPYERPFIAPLKTHHGDWAVRQGIFIFLREQGSGHIGVGEIAPLPWFGTETLKDAIAFCERQPSVLPHAQLLAIPSRLPCTQFGFGTALEALNSSRAEKIVPPPESICGLLPASEAALDAWMPLWQAGHRTFKWKIGVASTEQELRVFASLLDRLPSAAKLRLDANGGLTLDQAQQWCIACDRATSSAPTLEYFEQPLPPDQWRSLQTLASHYQTPIALDESVASLHDLRLWQNRHWPGFYIVKPAIMGFPWETRQTCKLIENPIVCSSVFETQVGRAAALALAHSISPLNLALGFGVDHWLATSPSVSINSSIFS